MNAADLCNFLEYDKENGELKWKPRKSSRWNARHSGTKAGCISSSNGYLTLSINNQKYLSHRVAWAIFYGEWPAGQIDHIDHNRTNNRISNLRCVTHSENGKNQKRRARTRDGEMGITKRQDTGKYQVRVCANGTRKTIGCFCSIEAAISARNFAYQELGFHKNHGAQHENT